MELKKFVSKENGDQNAYAIKSTGKWVVIDPNAELNRSIPADEIGAVLLTHGHYDHLYGSTAAREHCALYIHTDDAHMLTSPEANLSASFALPFSIQPADILLQGGTALNIENIHIDVLHTPGHSPGSVCYIISGCAFTGDTLFDGAFGRFDFPGGSAQQLRTSLRKIFALPQGTIAYPGHYGSTTTSQQRTPLNTRTL